MKKRLSGWLVELMILTDFSSEIRFINYGIKS